MTATSPGFQWVTMKTASSAAIVTTPIAKPVNIQRIYLGSRSTTFCDKRDTIRRRAERQRGRGRDSAAAGAAVAADWASASA